MGTVAYYAAKRLTHGHLICLDLSERWLNVCRKTLQCYEDVTILHAEGPSIPPLSEDSFDIIYCHFVLHDISESDLETIFPALVKTLKSGGFLIFREPLKEVEKLRLIKRLVTKNGLSHNESRIIDIPIMGSALESVYMK